MKGNRVKDGMLALLALLFAILITVVGFVALAIWWLESRFGSEMALTTIGGTLGILVLLLGMSVGILSYRSGQRNSVNIVREIAGGLKETLKVEGKIASIDERRVDQIAQERAKLLTVQPTWSVENPQEQSIKVYE